MCVIHFHKQEIKKDTFRVYEGVEIKCISTRETSFIQRCYTLTHAVLGCPRFLHEEVYLLS